MTGAFHVLQLPSCYHHSIISINLSSNKIQDEDILTQAYLGCPGKWQLNDCCRWRLSYGPPCPPVSLHVCLSHRPVEAHKPGMQACTRSRFGENKSPSRVTDRKVKVQGHTCPLNFQIIAVKITAAEMCDIFPTQLFTKTHAGVSEVCQGRWLLLQSELNIMSSPHGRRYFMAAITHRSCYGRTLSDASMLYFADVFFIGFLFFFMAALDGQTAERIFTKLSHVVDIRC